MTSDVSPSGTPGSPPRFEAGMLVVDALDRHPGAPDVFVRLGYRCVAEGPDDWCVVIEKDTLAKAAEMHGKPLDDLLGALNALPPAPPEAAGPAPGKPAEGAP
jgi:hypothetical protein